VEEKYFQICEHFDSFFRILIFFLTFGQKLKINCVSNHLSSRSSVEHFNGFASANICVRVRVYVCDREERKGERERKKMTETYKEREAEIEGKR